MRDIWNTELKTKIYILCWIAFTPRYRSRILCPWNSFSKIGTGCWTIIGSTDYWL